MNKFARMIDVLDLFSESVTLLTAEEIADLLQVSRPTAFRYARELSQAGFLANYSGRYSLGARIITLDYRIRQSDPVLKVASPVMRQLADDTGFGVILCRMYNDEVINEHHELGHWAAKVTFGRGRPLPLFRGSASKVMLGSLSTALLRKLYERYRHHPDVLAIGDDWDAFRKRFATIRADGHYVSREEVDEETVGIAAPIQVREVGTVGAIALVMPRHREAQTNIDVLAQRVMTRAEDIASELRGLGVSAPAAKAPAAQQS